MKRLVAKGELSWEPTGTASGFVATGHQGHYWVEPYEDRVDGPGWVLNVRDNCGRGFYLWDCFDTQSEAMAEARHMDNMPMSYRN